MSANMDDLRARVEQIRRAHASAKPKPSNPAWQNSHHDLGVALKYLEAREAVTADLLEALVALHAVARVDSDAEYVAVTNAAQLIAEVMGS